MDITIYGHVFQNEVMNGNARLLVHYQHKSFHKAIDLQNIYHQDSFIFPLTGEKM